MTKRIAKSVEKKWRMREKRMGERTSEVRSIRLRRELRSAREAVGRRKEKESEEIFSVLPYIKGSFKNS